MCRIKPGSDSSCGVWRERSGTKGRQSRWMRLQMRLLLLMVLVLMLFLEMMVMVIEVLAMLVLRRDRRHIAIDSDSGRRRECGQCGLQNATATTSSSSTRSSSTAAATAATAATGGGGRSVVHRAPCRVTWRVVTAGQYSARVYVCVRAGAGVRVRVRGAPSCAAPWVIQSDATICSRRKSSVSLYEGWFFQPGTV